jgi:tRNA-modifying protein YgfZ
MHDRSDRLRMTFTGDQAKAALGGLVTNDVVALQPGEGQRAAALTPKGRVIALCRIFDRGQDLLVDCDAAAGEGFAAMIHKFVNPRLAKHAVITDATGCIGVHGDDAAARLARAIGADAAVRDALAALAPLGGRWIGDGDEALFVVRSDDLSVAGFDAIGARARVESVRATLAADGTRSATATEILAHRLERGLPSWGAEMDAETIPQEANLDLLGAISFNKGCYTGQEVVARIHFRGHVNRHLRWLVSDAPLRAGARVLDANGADVGDVRSSVATSARGALAMAMVRREVESGATVSVRDAEGATSARVEPIEGP